MGLALIDGQWKLEAGGTGAAGYDETAGAKGAELLRNSASSILTGSLLPPIAAVAQANIFSAKGFGGTTGTNSTRIYATPLVNTNLDLNDFSSGFTWVGWVKADGSITNNNSTIFFSSQPDGKDAVKIYVNLYIPDWSVPNSRDEKKLRQCQAKNSESVVWVDDIHELKLMLKKILTDREQKPKTISA